MSMYDREWYRKESEMKRRRQEGADAMWNEVEPSRRKNQQRAAGTAAPVKPSKLAEKLVPTVCPHCGYSFSLRLPMRQINSYSYQCQSCGKKISVRTRSTGDTIATVILWVLGIPAVLLVLGELISAYLADLIRLFS